MKIRRPGLWTICFSVFMLFLSVFLLLRAKDEYRWSDWGSGDAQTILSINQWEKGGWLASKLLFTPQGYARAIGMLDEPQLSHHAHGSSASSLCDIGPKLRYTHYPSGYLVPYALLFKFGHSIFLLRCLAVFFSLSALVFMYISFSLIVSSRVAFLAVSFYALSRAFLGYADSLANQPLDDFFRFAFMLATILSARLVSSRAKRISLVLAWLIEFFLSLSSFDSVFFVFGWLIGWDFLERRPLRWRRYLVFAMAPLLAHTLCFFQNAWYLGLSGALADIKGVFLAKSCAAGASSVIGGLAHAVMAVAGSLCSQLDIAVAMTIFYILSRKFILPEEECRRLPSLRLLAVLGLCGMLFGLIFPSAAVMRYEARQAAPFMAVLASGCTWSFIKSAGFGKRAGFNCRIRIGIVLFGLTVALFWFFFAFLDRKPAFDSQRIRNNPNVLLAQRISRIPTIYEPVFFSVNGFSAFLNTQPVPYPQIQPMIEHYLGDKPVLCFNRPEALAEDLSYMLRRSPARFSPVLISENQEDIEKVLHFLASQGQIKEEPERLYYIMGKYVMAMGRSLVWK